MKQPSNPPQAPTSESHTPELSARLIYTLLTPAVRLARHARIDLATMKEWTELAYFQELQREGAKQREMAALMDISMSKVALLSRQLKESFIQPELHTTLAQRIEMMLLAQPLSRLKLHQILSDVSLPMLDETLKELTDAERITLVQRNSIHVYQLTSQAQQGTSHASLERLQSALIAIAETAHAHLFGTQHDTHAPSAQSPSLKALSELLLTILNAPPSDPS